MRPPRAARRQARRYLLKVVQDAGRSCGECRACCGPVFEVEGVKRSDETCKHACDSGCSIYARRPSVCATYYCGWRMGVPGSADSDRPDMSGVIFTLSKASSPGNPVWQSRVLAYTPGSADAIRRVGGALDALGVGLYIQTLPNAGRSFFVPANNSVFRSWSAVAAAHPAC